MAMIAATIEQAGGPEAFNSKLATVHEAAGFVGGARELGALLTGKQPRNDLLPCFEQQLDCSA